MSLLTKEGALSATSWVIASDAPAIIQAYARTLLNDGFPVYICSAADSPRKDQVNINLATALGGICLLSAGHFVGDVGVRPPNGGRLVGAGRGATFYTLKNNAAAGYIIDLSGLTDSDVEDLTVDGNASNQVNSIQGIGMASSSTRCHVHRCLVKNTQSHAFTSEVSIDCLFEACHALNAGSHGFDVGYGQNMRMSKCVSDGAGKVYAGGNGFFIITTADGTPERNSLVQCTALNSANDGFLIQRANRNVLSACLSYNNAEYGFHIFGDGTGNADENLLQGCLAYDTRAAASKTQTYGVYVEGLGNANRNKVRSCQLEGNKTGNIYDGGYDTALERLSPIGPAQAGVIHNNILGNGRYVPSTSAPGAGLLVASPFPLGRDVTVDAIAFTYDTGGAAIKIQAAIHADNGNGYPGRQLAAIAETSLPNVAQSYVTAALVGGAITIRAARQPLWLIFIVNDAGVRIGTWADGYTDILGGATVAAMAGNVNLAQAYGAIPNPFPGGGTYAIHLWGLGLEVTALPLLR